MRRWRSCDLEGVFNLCLRGGQNHFGLWRRSSEMLWWWMICCQGQQRLLCAASSPGLLCWLRPVFHLEQIVLDTVSEAIGVAFRVLQEKNVHSASGSRNIIANTTHLLINNPLPNRRDPGDYPFARSELIGQMSCSLQEVVRERNCQEKIRHS